MGHQDLIMIRRGYLDTFHFTYQPRTLTSIRDHQWVTEHYESGMVGLVPKGSDWIPNWTNPGLFQIRFQIIWLIEPNVLKSDLKKSRICPIWGPIWPTLEPNLPSLAKHQNLQTEMSGLTLNWVRLASNGTNLEVFYGCISSGFSESFVNVFFKTRLVGRMWVGRQLWNLHNFLILATNEYFCLACYAAVTFVKNKIKQK